MESGQFDARDCASLLLAQILHVAVRLVLFRSSVGKWSIMGFLVTALIELVCYRALAQIAGGNAMLPRHLQVLMCLSLQPSV